MKSMATTPWVGSWMSIVPRRRAQCRTASCRCHDFCCPLGWYITAGSISEPSSIICWILLVLSSLWFGESSRAISFRICVGALRVRLAPVVGSVLWFGIGILLSRVLSKGCAGSVPCDGGCCGFPRWNWADLGRFPGNPPLILNVDSFCVYGSLILQKCSDHRWASRLSPTFLPSRTGFAWKYHLDCLRA